MDDKLQRGDSWNRAGTGLRAKVGVRFIEPNNVIPAEAGIHRM